MNISNKHNIAMNLLVAMEGGRVSLATAAERGGVSLSHLEQIAMPLRKSGLIRSTRGPGGGYELARPLNDIKLVDLLMCIGMNGNDPKNTLLTAILGALGSTTVAQAINTTVG